MFWLGMIIGFVAATVIMWWLLAEEIPEERSSYEAQRQIREIELETVRQLLAAELTRHATGATRRDWP